MGLLGIVGLLWVLMLLELARLVGLTLELDIQELDLSGLNFTRLDLLGIKDLEGRWVSEDDDASVFRLDIDDCDLEDLILAWVLGL